MDNPQTNATNGQDGPTDMLPPVQQFGGAGQPAVGSTQSVGAGGAFTPGSAGLQHDDSQQTIPNSRSLVAVPDSAGDNDLIEKEWVLKAKQIVEHTAEDPFLQQQELSKMKADYMKKRYNKDLGMV